MKIIKNIKCNIRNKKKNVLNNKCNTNLIFIVFTFKRNYIFIKGGFYTLLRCLVHFYYDGSLYKYDIQRHILLCCLLIINRNVYIFIHLIYILTKFTVPTFNYALIILMNYGNYVITNS